MTESSPSFLDSLDIQRDRQGFCTPATSVDTAESWLTPLGQYGMIGVHGPDAERFLQGQLSCDVRTVSQTQAALGAYCSPKGRALASFVLAAPTPEHYRLRLRLDICADTAATLARYVVFSKAQVEDLSASWVLLGLWGTTAASRAGEWLGSMPEGRLQTAGDGDSLLLQLDDTGHRHELWLPAARARSAWEHLRGQLPVAPSRWWQRLDIEAGIAEIHAGNREQFLPEMLNYPETGAVSFRKGCYTGQEVIARMHYRGQRKRALYRLRQDGGPDPSPGDAVYRGQQVVGEVFAALDGELLAILNTSQAEATDLCLHQPERPLHHAGLPYRIVVGSRDD